MINYLPHNEQTALVFAARYAHTRQTAAASLIVDVILANWNRLTYETKEQLKREAKNEATCNHDDWKRLINK
jgi:hypothetical protein